LLVMTEPRTDLDGEGVPDAPDRVVLHPRNALALAEAEANHRIANNLAIVAAYLRLQASDVAALGRSLTPEQANATLREAASRVESVGKIHRHLAHTTTLRSVDISGYLEELCGELAASMAYNGRITFDGRGGACFISQDRVVPLALCVLEAVTNAMKYAHPGGVAGLVAVRCAVDEDGGVEIEIEDDGVGLPEGFDPRSSGGLGLRVMRSLVAQLGGDVAFDSEGLGLTVRISAP